MHDGAISFPFTQRKGKYFKYDRRILDGNSQLHGVEPSKKLVVAQLIIIFNNLPVTEPEDFYCVHRIEPQDPTHNPFNLFQQHFPIHAVCPSANIFLDFIALMIHFGEYKS
jgi:hypothetical protein